MSVTRDDFLNHTGERIPEILPEEVQTYFEGRYFILDVREASDRRTGYIQESIHIPSGLLEAQLCRSNTVVLHPWSSILVYSNSGWRGGLATFTLQRIGYRHAVNLKGGFERWREAALPIEVPRQAW